MCPKDQKIWASTWQNQQNECVPTEDSDQPGHPPPVWSESSLSTWRKLGFLATHWADSEGSDQTGRMPRLIRVLLGAQSLCWFCHEAAHIEDMANSEDWSNRIILIWQTVKTDQIWSFWYGKQWTLIKQDHSDMANSEHWSNRIILICTFCLGVSVPILDLMIKPTKWVSAQWRLRSAWASAQSVQSLRCVLNG